jgi:hypothetical protein
MNRRKRVVEREGNAALVLGALGLVIDPLCGAGPMARIGVLPAVAPQIRSMKEVLNFNFSPSDNLTTVHNDACVSASFRDW